MSLGVHFALSAPQLQALRAAQALDGTEVGEEGFWTTH